MNNDPLRLFRDLLTAPAVAEFPLLRGSEEERADMEEAFKDLAGYIALGMEVIAAMFIAYGAVEAIFGLLMRRVGARSLGAQILENKKEIYVRFGEWMLLGLEFELGADIVRTAISPTWSQIGQLGAIALIRTFLNYFLERDVEKYTGPVRASNSEQRKSPQGILSRRAHPTQS
jgi:uncharacterized membrane protein